jgi:hypothetical protein
MRRTNIYLEDEKLVLLKMLAADEGTSVADIVRSAVDQWLAAHLVQQKDWGQRLDLLTQRIRDRVPTHASPAEIEADITAARAELRP